MTPTDLRELEPERFLALDSLRGVAACLVVFFHLPSSGYIWDNPIVKNGFLAVTFFFVLSGFIMGITYGNRFSEGYSLIRYMALRAGRLYPLHLFIIGCIFAWELVRLAGNLPAHREGVPFAGNTNFADLPLNLLMLQHFADPYSWNRPSWSIGAEWWTYLAFALLAGFAGFRRKLHLTAATLIVPYLVLRIGNYDIGSGWRSMIDCMMNFGAGLLIFELRKAALVQSIADRIGRSAASIIEGLVLAFALLMIAWFGSWLSPLITPAFALVILVFSYERGAISRMLTAGPLLVLGSLSYSIYMIHQFVLDRLLELVAVIATEWGLPLLLNETGRLVLVGDRLACDLLILVMLCLVVALSWFTYRHIEMPARKWSRQIIGSGKRADAGTSAATF